MSLSQMASAIRSRQLSPVELVEAHLRQIEKVNPLINAFVMQFPSEARGAALRAQDERPEGPLHGIPVTIKDSFDMRDLPTLCGSQFRLSHRAPRDSTAVTRLREAGAIILGKTNCPEFLANWETDNYLTGRTNNPWNLDYTAGGSSGGESAAIAAFCSAGGVGSDGGGSIRVPAAFTGIAGLKPTPGRVSAAGHFPEISHPGGLLGVAGPMARTVEDVRILFNVLSGYDPADPFSAPVAKSKPDESPVPIGFVSSVTGRPVQEPVSDALTKAGICLQQIGHAVEPFSTATLEHAIETWWFFFGEISAPFTREVFQGRESEAHWTGLELLGMVDPAWEITGKQVVERLGQRDRMRAALLAKMEQTPVLLAPVCGVTAFRHGTRSWPTPQGDIGLLDAMSQVTPFNLLGLPGLAVPMGLTPEGIPVGIQLVGRPWEEERLLAIGEQLENVRGPLGIPTIS